jgi:hypothetical protein
MLQCLVLLALAAGAPARADDVLPGDVNADGRVDGGDWQLFYRVIYERAELPVERIHAMDLDGDGLADIDDLVGLRRQLADRRPAARRPRAATLPFVVPRFGATLHWIPGQRRAHVALVQRLRELEALASDRHAASLAALRLRELDRDLRFSRHYGLVCGPEIDALSARVATLTSAWGEAVRRLDEPIEGSEYTLACAARLGPNEEREIGGILRDRCEGGPGGGVTYVFRRRFYVSRAPNGHLRVRLPIGLRIDDDVPPAEKARFEQQWAEATQCLRVFWHRYGVRFILDYDDASAYHAIHLWRGNERGDASTLFVGATQYRSNLCSWLIHELGHHLGVRDGYMEPGRTCAERREEPKDSVMNNGAVRPDTQLRFYPHHLTTIFGDVCGPYPGGRR